ncbi:MAG: aminoglycoside phosphotransferase family protein [Rhodospirillales bacterium]
MNAPVTAAADLAAALAIPGVGPDDLRPLRSKGMAHAHWRAGDRGPVVRVPRWSQTDLAPLVHLETEAAAFRRAEPSGHVPRLLDVVAPSARLPMGALLVDAVDGRPPRLPADLAAVAAALAAIHALPLPVAADRAPLASPADPVRATADLVGRQAVWFERIPLPSTVRDRLSDEVAWAARLPGAGPPTALVGVDVHPGNVLVDRAGKAWVVDPERMQYGLPALDLAHATADTSTRFDPDVDALLGDADVARFVAAWAAAVPPDLSRDAATLFPVARRLVRLRTLAWMARWKADVGPAQGGAVDPAVRAHVDRVITALLG